MKRSRSILRPVLLFFAILSVFICPLTSGSFLFLNSHAGALNQIDFTPHVSPLALTQTPASLEIDPNLRSTPMPVPTYGAGQYIEGDDPNWPELDEDLIIGDGSFGYARLAENPDLYAVWITDESGMKHYLIVDKDSEVFTGGSDPDSYYLSPVKIEKTIFTR